MRANCPECQPAGRPAGRGPHRAQVRRRRDPAHRGEPAGGRGGPPQALRDGAASRARPQARCAPDPNPQLDPAATSKRSRTSPSPTGARRGRGRDRLPAPRDRAPRGRQGLFRAARAQLRAHLPRVRAKEALHVCEAMRCQPVVVDVVIGVVGINPFRPGQPIGVWARARSSRRPRTRPGSAVRLSALYSGGRRRAGGPHRGPHRRAKASWA